MQFVDETQQNAMATQVCMVDHKPSQPVTQRNFLRENKLMVRRSTLSRRELMEGESNRCRCWPRTLPQAPRYEVSTKSSLTRRHAAQLNMQCHSTNRQHSEKQIQTEDINDEQFLTAALLKCTEHVHSGAQGSQAQFLRGCSEGDEPCVAYASTSCDDASTHQPHPMRRTISNFELGTMPAQRNICQLVPSILHPQPCAVLGIGSTSGSGRLLRKSVNATAEVELKEAEVINGDSDSSDKPSLHVLQMAIPGITDVELEPQLDQPLSTRTNVSCSSQRSKCSSSETVPTVSDDEQAHQTTELEKKPTPHADQVLLTELQRISLLEAAQARYRELIWQYNRLPLSMGTLRVRNLKVRLEQQLDSIDSDLMVLNLPKVYVSRDHLLQIPSVLCQRQ